MRAQLNSILALAGSVYRRSPRRVVLSVALLALMAAVEAGGILLLIPVIETLAQVPEGARSKVALFLGVVFERLHLSLGIYSCMALFFGAVCAKSFMSFFAKKLLLRIQADYEHFLQSELMRALMRSRWRYYSDKNSGILFNVLSKEVEVIGYAIFYISDSAANLLKILFYTGVAVTLSPFLMLILSVLAAAAVVPSMFMGTLILRKSAERVALGNSNSKIILESLAGIKLIKSFAREDIFIRRFELQLRTLKDAVADMLMLRQVNSLLFEPTAVLILTLILFLGINVLKLKFPDLLVLLYTLRSLLPLVSQIMGYKDVINSSIPSFELVRHEIEAAQKAEELPGTLPFSGLRESIQFKDVHFSYRKGEPVLAGASLDIAKGEMVGLVGSSGAGKTTILDLLFEFQTPLEGQILVDGAPLGRYDVRSFRGKVGFVPQDSFLFDGTILDNLTWGEVQPRADRIERATRLAHIHDFIVGLPLSYQTVVGERGVKLSNGQRQRIALARALYQEPEILILDEATSALDSESESAIQEAIVRIKGSLTIIVVAHRLSTIKGCDRIYVIEAGKVVESGTYADLMREKGRFFRFASIQGMS